MWCRVKAFTLIELLIVVAIIAILAAIAVPNFLEAQTRAKVSRVKADMRSFSTANETYAIDNNMYLLQNQQSRALALNNPIDQVFERVTTPIAYITSAVSFKSPFRASRRIAGDTLDTDTAIPVNQLEISQIYGYYARNNGNANGSGSAQWGRTDPKPAWYFTLSAGPMGRLYGFNDASRANLNDTASGQALASSSIYEATNGTISAGDIYRVGGGATPLAKALYDAMSRSQ